MAIHLPDEKINITWGQIKNILSSCNADSQIEGMIEDFHNQNSTYEKPLRPQGLFCLVCYPYRQLEPNFNELVPKEYDYKCPKCGRWYELHEGRLVCTK